MPYYGLSRHNLTDFRSSSRFSSIKPSQRINNLWKVDLMRCTIPSCKKEGLYPFPLLGETMCEEHLHEYCQEKAYFQPKESKSLRKSSVITTGRAAGKVSTPLNLSKLSQSSSSKIPSKKPRKAPGKPIYCACGKVLTSDQEQRTGVCKLCI